MHNHESSTKSQYSFVLYVKQILKATFTGNLEKRQHIKQIEVHP